MEKGGGANLKSCTFSEKKHYHKEKKHYLVNKKK
jgi:hypothetical protein